MNSPKVQESPVLRRSLGVAKMMVAGEKFSTDNVRAIRYGSSLSPKYLDVILGGEANQYIAARMPLDWLLVD